MANRSSGLPGPLGPDKWPSGLEDFRSIPDPVKPKSNGSGGEGGTPENTFHDSRSLNDREIVKTQKPTKKEMPLLEVIKIWEQPEPEPRRWAIEGLVPDGVITTLFGDGGMGKSYIGLYWAMLSCLGWPFCGRAVEKRTALYVDAELDHVEFERRSYKVARGMGLEKPPVGLHYANLPGSLKDPVVQEKVRVAILGLDVGITILDSLSVASYGSDAKESKDVIDIMMNLRGWGTMVALDHITKVVAGSNLSNYTQFGSAFKKFLARSSVKVIQAPGGGISLQNDKANFGPKSPPIYMSMTFEPDALLFRQVDERDEVMAGIDEHLPAIEQTWVALMNQEDSESSVTYLGEILSRSGRTIQNHLTTLKKQGRVRSIGNSVWRGIRHAPTVEVDASEEIPF